MIKENIKPTNTRQVAEVILVLFLLAGASIFGWSLSSDKPKVDITASNTVKVTIDTVNISYKVRVAQLLKAVKIKRKDLKDCGQEERNSFTSSEGVRISKIINVDMSIEDDYKYKMLGYYYYRLKRVSSNRELLIENAILERDLRCYNFTIKDIYKLKTK